MDELKLKLRTNFMKNIVTKIISKIILKKLGYRMDIQLNKVEMENFDGKIHIHVDVEAELDNDELLKIVKDTELI